MGKLCTDSVMDAALDYISTNACAIVVVGGSAYDSSATLSSSALASATIATASFTKANGDANGRKLTVPTKSGCTISQAGTASHVVIANANRSAIYQTTCTEQALTTGTVDVTTYDIEIADPT